MTAGRRGTRGRLATTVTLLCAALWLFPLSETFRSVRRTFSLDSLGYLLGDDPAAGLTRRWLLNSAGTTVTITLLTLLISLPCAYAASRLDFPGKRALYWALLAGLMIPKEVLIVPHFVLMDRFGWLDSYPGIVMPQVVFPLVILVLQRFFDGVPRQYREAASLDGAGEMRILTAVYLPLSLRVVAALGALVFVTAWNNFLWPFIVTFEQEVFTLPVAVGEGDLQTLGVGLTLLFVALAGGITLRLVARTGLIDAQGEGG